MGARHRRRDAGPDPGRRRTRATPTKAEAEDLCRAVTLPGARRPRRRRPDHPGRARRAGGRADRRRARAPGGLGPLPERARPGRREPGCGASSRSGSTDRQRAPRSRAWSRAIVRPKRALYVSSPIGLGHAWRDVAIADELRRRVPGLEIHWLAQEPVTTVLHERGETIHPASAELASRERPHRPRGGRARPARVRGAAAHGRHLLRELHAVRRRRARGRATTCGSATRRGRSTTSCTRTPSARSRPTRG